MIVTEPLVYEDEQGNAFEGTYSWDDALSGLRPGVMVASTFMGQSAFETQKAEALAELGYVVYGHTGHAFTNPKATDKANGLFFVPRAAERGWQVMKDFLAETL